jgi:hypothetical protein
VFNTASLHSSLSFDRYWNDPFKHEEYLRRNVFLPDLNNEFASKNRQSSPLPRQCPTVIYSCNSLLFFSFLLCFTVSHVLNLCARSAHDLTRCCSTSSSTYKQRLLSLKSLVLVMFTHDSMVKPPKNITAFSLQILFAAGSAARELPLRVLRFRPGQGRGAPKQQQPVRRPFPLCTRVTLCLATSRTGWDCGSWMPKGDC